MQQFNKSMSEVRISVEWLFNDIINYFKFMDFKKNLKVGLSSVGKMCIVSGLLHNSTIQLLNNWGAVLYTFAVVVILFSTSL